MPRRQRRSKQVATLRHDEAKRTNIPTAEYSSAMEEADRSAIEVAYARRNRDLDPQFVWRGKDEQDLSDLLVQAPPLYIQEKQPQPQPRPQAAAGGHHCGAAARGLVWPADSDVRKAWEGDGDTVVLEVTYTVRTRSRPLGGSFGQWTDVVGTATGVAALRPAAAAAVHSRHTGHTKWREHHPGDWGQWSAVDGEASTHYPGAGALDRHHRVVVAHAC